MVGDASVSWSECVISRVLSCFTCWRGVRCFCVFVVFAAHVLLNAVISRVLAWFWVVLGKIAFFMTLFFCILESWTLAFLVGCWYFWSFGLVLSGLGLVVCVCYVSVFGAKLVEFCCCDTWMSTTVMRMMM